MLTEGNAVSSQWGFICKGCHGYGYGSQYYKGADTGYDGAKVDGMRYMSRASYRQGVGVNKMGSYVRLGGKR